MAEGNKSRKWISDIIGDKYKKWNKEYIQGRMEMV